MHDEPEYAIAYVPVMHYALQIQAGRQETTAMRVLPLGAGLSMNVIRYVMRHVMHYKMRYLVAGASIAFVMALLKPAVRPR